MNYAKTVFLLVALTVLLMWIGGLIGGQNGVIIAFVISLVMNGISYWFSDKIVLAMYGAKELPKDAYPHIHRTVAGLCAKIQMPVPRIFIADMDAPNAFATGRDPARGVLCFTRGILSTLSEREIRGVISHELAHIKNRDTLLMTVTASIASTIMMLSSMARWAAMFGGVSRDRDDDHGSNIISLIAISIVAPLAAMLIQMAISRSREYMADESGAKMTGDPEGLATALLDMTKKAGLSDVSANPQTALLFIVSPFGKLGMITNLFSTHPPVEERVKRLRSMTS